MKFEEEKVNSDWLLLKVSDLIRFHNEQSVPTEIFINDASVEQLAYVAARATECHRQLSNFYTELCEKLETLDEDIEANQASLLDKALLSRYREVQPTLKSVLGACEKDMYRLRIAHLKRKVVNLPKEELNDLLILWTERAERRESLAPELIDFANACREVCADALNLKQ